MSTKALHKTPPKPRSTEKRRTDGAALPSVEAAKLRLNDSKGLFAPADLAATAAFLDYDGPVLAGATEHDTP